jgi:hypothetical protein
MQWFIPAVGVLICLVGMCALMGGMAFLGRWRDKRADNRSSARVNDPGQDL